jgi:hypothetical protein
MEIKPPASLLYDSKREEADEQMRRRIRDLRHELAIPALHGICAFGTQLSVYEYDSATSNLSKFSGPALPFLLMWRPSPVGIVMFSSQRGKIA